jgi:threonine dehydrogenase-like Zn-dependent dehydrogenase
MKVVVCEKPGRLALIDRPQPTSTQGEVLVQIRRIGVCGTDFHIFGGKHPFLEYPRVMGHELSGTVVTTPEGSALEPGQNVYIVTT